ncbi:hypothetical protein DDU33_10170 [Actinobacillus porcitonsillarum]|uniref:Uncharacterized protein n=1 Tax=Actinobacillus porcitonsillarum TaxID=189834 RepID=A0A2U8FN57_9PAST|nr:tetratricopeptide repeat protein [Actinobacillus porcitonsillarum]AWI51824.1 hypothetical protein DDU33_10170 [Actinobacillus porcitonsillarum]
MTEKEIRSQLKFYWYILLFIGLVCFIVFSIIAISEKFAQKGAWEATISVFSLLGVLLTAGGVFAGTVAILSYFSVKEKLDKAESELDKIRDIQQRYEFAENNIKGLENYQLVVDELNKNFSETKKEKFYEMARNISEAKNPDYHIKIKANAILLEKEADKAYKSKKWSEAVKYYEELVDLWKLLFLYDKRSNIENYLLAIFRLATSISQANSKNKYEKASELYELLIAKANDLEIKSDVVSFSYNNWGNVLVDEANLISKYNPQEARKLFQQAGEKYKKAIELNPKESDAYYNWGNVLDDEAQLISKDNPQEARKLLKQAGEKYKKAIELNPENSEAYYNWGNAFGYEANLISKDNPQEVENLFQQAKEMYVKAIKIKPDYQTAYNNLKMALSKLDDFLGKEKKHDYWQQVQEEIMSLPDSEPKQDMLKFIEKQISSTKAKP